MFDSASEYGIDNTVASNILKAKHPSPARIALAAALCPEVLFERKSWASPASLVAAEKLTSMCGKDPMVVRNALAHWVGKYHLFQTKPGDLRSYNVVNMAEIYRWDRNLGAWIAVAVAERFLSLAKNPKAGGPQAVELFAYCKQTLDKSKELLSSSWAGMSPLASELNSLVALTSNFQALYNGWLTSEINRNASASPGAWDINSMEVDDVGIRAFTISRDVAGSDLWNNRLGANCIAKMTVAVGTLVLTARDAVAFDESEGLFGRIDQMMSLGYNASWYAVPISGDVYGITLREVGSTMSAAIYSYPVHYSGQRRRSSGELSQGMKTAGMRAAAAGVGALVGAAVGGMAARSLSSRGG